MAPSANQTADRIEAGVQRGYADAAGLYQGNLEAMVASGQAMISGYQSVNAEVLAFAQSRMKETLEMSRRLASCQSPEGAFEVQVDYARSSLKAYADEMQKLADMTGRLMNEAFSPLARRGDQLETATSRAVAA